MSSCDHAQQQVENCSEPNFTNDGQEDNQDMESDIIFQKSLKQFNAIHNSKWRNLIILIILFSVFPY